MGMNYITRKDKKEKFVRCSNIAETKVAHLGELDEADSWGGDCWMIQQKLQQQELQQR